MTLHSNTLGCNLLYAHMLVSQFEVPYRTKQVLYCSLAHDWQKVPLQPGSQSQVRLYTLLVALSAVQSIKICKSQITLYTNITTIDIKKEGLYAITAQRFVIASGTIFAVLEAWFGWWHGGIYQYNGEQQEGEKCGHLNVLCFFFDKKYTCWSNLSAKCQIKIHLSMQ